MQNGKKIAKTIGFVSAVVAALLIIVPVIYGNIELFGNFYFSGIGVAIISILLLLWSQTEKTKETLLVKRERPLLKKKLNILKQKLYPLVGALIGAFIGLGILTNTTFTSDYTIINTIIFGAISGSIYGYILKNKYSYIFGGGVIGALFGLHPVPFSAFVIGGAYLMLHLRLDKEHLRLRWDEEYLHKRYLLPAAVIGACVLIIIWLVKVGKPDSIAVLVALGVVGAIVGLIPGINLLSIGLGGGILIGDVLGEGLIDAPIFITPLLALGGYITSVKLERQTRKVREFKSKIKEWKEEGYDVLFVEEILESRGLILQKAKNGFIARKIAECEKNIQRLKQIKRELNSICERFDIKAQSIKSKLNNPKKIKEIKKEFKLLKEAVNKISDSESLFNEGKNYGINITKPKKLVVDARKALAKGDFKDALNFAKNAERMAKRIDLTKITELKKRMKSLKEKQPSIIFADIGGLIKDGDKKSLQEAERLLHQREKQYEMLGKKEILDKRFNSLRKREPSIRVDDIKKLLEKVDEESLTKANELLDERKKQYEQFLHLKNEIKRVENREKNLTKQIADEKIPASSYEKASNNLEHEKKELEEQLWQLRSQLFKEDYEKPF